MKKTKDAITQERLRELLSYDPDTGVFTRNITVGYQAKAGSTAGVWRGGGYLRTQIEGNKYYNHRLAWLYVHGRFPTHCIDHINGDPSDNRICNLREACQAENIANGKFRSTNTTGVKGLILDKRNGRWRGNVRRHYKNYYTPSFECPEEAVEALRVLREKLHKEFAKHD